MIGRTRERQLLTAAYESKKSELIAVVGRRRVGKTHLITSHFKGKIDFEMMGLQKGTKEQQLRNFAYCLKEAKRS
jgi:hypothetical protein